MSVSRRLGAVLRLSSGLLVILTLAWIASAIATGPANHHLLNARAAHTATAQVDGSLLIAGGTGNRGVMKSLEFFDPVSGRSSPGPRLNEARSGHSAIALADGRVLLTGGHNGDNALLASSEIYDAAGTTLNPGASMGHARANHTSTLLADGRVLIAGGDAEGMAEIYNPATDRFVDAARLAVARSGHSAVRLGDGRVLLVGGTGAAGATAEIFDPKTNTSSAVRGGLKTARVQPSLKLISDGKVQVYGGDAEITMEVYNPAGYFSSRGHLLRDSSAFRSVMYSPGQTALIAIPSAKGKHYAEDALGPAAGEFERTGHTATEVAAHSTMVVVGGFGTTGAVLDTVTELGSCSGTVTTDLTDYHPGDTVIMSGSGWTPGEQITLNLHRDSNDPPDATLYATADENGDWINAEYVVQDFDLGVTFVLTASGDSGCSAQTTFTDSGSMSYSPGTASLTIAAGSFDSFSQNVTAPNGNGSFTASLQVAGTGVNPLPAAWVSTSPTLLSFSTTALLGDTKIWSVKVTVPVATAAGTYTAQIKANPSIPGIGVGSGTALTVIVTASTSPTTTVVTFDQSSPYTYTGSAFTAQAVVTGSGGFSQSVSVTYTGDCTNVTVANGCTASASFAGDATHAPSSDSKSITIVKASSTTTVTFEAGPYVYRNSAFTATAQATGIGLSPVDVTASIVYSGDCTNVTVPNGCTATATYAGDANHTGSNGNASITITKATSTTTVTFESGPYTYRGTAFTATAQATGVGLSPVNVTASIVYSGDCTNVTVANGCTATASYAGDANHTGSNGNASITIEKATSTTTVTFETGPYTYRGTAFTATAQATGIGLSPVDVTASIVYSGDCTNVTVANGCTATATYAGDANHTGSNGNASITITKATSTTTVTFETGPYTYRGTAFTATAQATGIGLSPVDVTASIVYSGDCTNVTVANGCTATATYAGDANHTGSNGNASITITKATSTTTVTFETGPYTYRGTAFTATAQATGIGLSPVDVTASIVYSGDCTNVTVANGCTATATYAGDANHTGSNGNASITITKATSTTTVTFETGPYTYRGTAFTATAQATGIGLSPVDVTASIVYSGDCTNVTVANGCTATATYAGDANHTGSNGNASITITKATSTTTVTFESGPYTYRGTAFTATAQATGVGLSPVNVTASIVYSGDCTNVTVANGCTATASYAGDANHTGSNGNASITIEKATSTTTVTFESGPYTYRGTAFTATAQATGVGLSPVNVTASIVYSGDCTNVTVANGCTATASYAGDANHTGSTGNASITITQAPSTTFVTCPSAHLPYTGLAQTPCTANVTGVGGLSQSLIVSYTNNINAGTAGASASFGGDTNHLPSSGSSSFVIDKVQLTVKADNINKFFGDPIILTYTITGFVNNETVAVLGGAASCTTTATQWSPVGQYPITCTIGTLTAANYTFTFVGGTLTVTSRGALVNYIGQQVFVTSGSSSTTAQVTLSASVQDPTGLGLSGAKVDFIDCNTGKTLAGGVPVSPVQNQANFTGTANTIVTLSTGQFGSQSYLILVKMTGNYNNLLQPTADKTATVVVMQPPALYQTMGGGMLSTASGTYAGTYAGNGDEPTFSVGMTYNKSLSNLKGQITLTIPQAGGVVYVKSNSISSMAITGTGDSQSATIYTKSNMSEVLNNGTTVAIDGNVTLRMDIVEGSPASVGFTVLSSKDSSLFYSNSWQLTGPPPGVWKTVAETTDGAIVTIQ